MCQHNIIFPFEGKLTKEYYTVSLPEHKQCTNIHFHKEGSNTVCKVTSENVKNAAVMKQTDAL